MWRFIAGTAPWLALVAFCIGVPIMEGQAWPERGSILTFLAIIFLIVPGSFAIFSPNLMLRYLGISPADPSRFSWNSRRARIRVVGIASLCFATVLAASLL